MFGAKRSIFDAIFTWFVRERTVRAERRELAMASSTAASALVGVSAGTGRNAAPADRESPSSDETAAPPRPDEVANSNRRDDRVTRLVALVLMALATLGSAWCGFQAGLWNGIQTFRLTDYTKAARISSQDSLTADLQRNLDAAMFVEYCRALSEHNMPLANFLHDRLRPEFRPAMEAWLATKPLQNKGAPATPFEMPQYSLQAQREASELDAQASTEHNQAQKANTNGDSYTLSVLLFTSALFLGGLITGFDDLRTRWMAIALSLVFVVMASGVLLSLPVAHRG